MKPTSRARGSVICIGANVKSETLGKAEKFGVGDTQAQVDDQAWVLPVESNL
jgi:hypothetical protein